MAQAYGGAIGQTQTATVHVTDPRGALVAVEVHTSIDATSDPALVDRLYGETLNVARFAGGETIPLAVPVVYHDPAAEILVLVLGDAHRHRELEERIAVLERLRDDPATVPPYAKNFAVVFGPGDLRAHLAERAQLRDAAAELDRTTRQLGRDTSELDTLPVELDLLRREPRVGDTDRVELPVAAVAAIEVAEPGDDPLTTELTELPLAGPDDEIVDALIARGASACHADRTGVRVVVVAGESLARGLAGALEVRIVLHRTPSYPVLALVIGPPAALRAGVMPQLAILPLDVAAERDRAVLQELARSFELTAVVVAGGQRVRCCKLAAPLTENAAYILRAADDHLRGVAAGGEPGYAAARALVLDAGYDLLGLAHPERPEFRADKLAQIGSAQPVRRALAMARRFTRPAREDYLVCTRSFPLPRWRQLRRDLLVRAVAWGLWMGPDLAQVAVSEGLARSRRDLIGKLDRGFEGLRHNVAAFDIDADAAADNATALAEEARTLGVELRPIKANGAGAIASDTTSVVSGSIGSTPPRGTPWTPEAWSTDDLIAQLERTASPRGGRPQRLAAAIALCDRGDPQAAAPVVAAALKMNRSEAVRVLAMSTRFGASAIPALLEGLASSKAFLRHGSALALALSRSEGATHAVVKLLLSEPTELWREIARAIGQIGSAALTPLAHHYERLGDHTRPVVERVAWAMAHIAVRGGQAAIAAIADGPSIVAPIAAKALDLMVLAASDHVREPSGPTASGAERDLTVNHAFSRQFFEMLDRGLPEAEAADAAEAAPADTVER
jgi:hypothetical protein